MLALFVALSSIKVRRENVVVSLPTFFILLLNKENKFVYYSNYAILNQRALHGAISVNLTLQLLMISDRWLQNEK